MTRTLLVVVGLGLTIARPLAQADRAALPDVLKKTIASYATLTSYADTGTLRVEIPGVVNESKFTTYFRRQTRDLYFDFQDLASVYPDTKFTIDLKENRTVIWMRNGAMEKYDFKTQAHDIVTAENGGQVRALQSAVHGTQGVSILIPSLLYSKANLPGTLLQMEEATVAGVEQVNKHPCTKITGVAAAYYPSGQRTSVRPVTVWVDAETQLVRKVLEDTPKGYPAGAYLRITTTYEPQANPTLDDKKFQFSVPQ